MTMTKMRTNVIAADEKKERNGKSTAAKNVASLIKNKTRQGK